MTHVENYPVLKLSLNYALGVVDFSGELEDAHKSAIAKKLLEAGFAISSNLYQAKRAEKSSEYVKNIKTAQKFTDDTLYWLKQCLNSENYPKAPELLLMGETLYQQIEAMLSDCKTDKRKNT